MNYKKKCPRQGWSEQIKKARENISLADEEVFMDGISNEFCEKEWTWRPYNENDTDFAEEEHKEIKRRIKDLDNPIKYVVASGENSEDSLRTFFDVSNDVFCTDIDSATLFKRKNFAKAIIKELTSIDCYIAKVTMKNSKRKVLKYYKS